VAVSRLYTLRAGEWLLNRLLPEPYAALANGILPGLDVIPMEIQECFSVTGATHVLVISGTNAKG
jgi:hypothetical protein